MKSLIRIKKVREAGSVQSRNPGPCLNCGTWLWANDLYCPKCGQKRLEEEDLSFRHMIGESFLDYFHFDSKFFKTIVPLIFKPGRLTLEYMKGKRKTYVEPFRLFLVVSIIYFLLLPLSPESANNQDQNKAPQSSKNGMQPFNLSPKVTSNGKPLSKAGQDSMRREIDSIGIQKYVDKKLPKENWAIRLLVRHAYKITLYSGQSFITVMEHTASKMIFLLIPVFALLLKLFYLRSKRLYYEHLIFSLHIHAFIFLLFVAALVIKFFVPFSYMIPMLITLVYLFFALKKNYQEKSGRTFRKFFLLIIFYCIIALPIFFSLLIIVSVLMV